MAAQIFWYIDKRVIYERFHGEVTLEEFTDSVTAVEEMCAEGTPLIHVITDLLDITKWPPLLKLSGAASHETLPGMGWTIIIVNNPALRLISAVVTQFAMNRMRTVKNIDEAMEFLISHDVTLAGMPVN